MSALDLEHKLESALAAWIAADSGVVARSLSVVTGSNDDAVTLPRVVCRCLGGNEEPMNTGNYFLDVQLDVETKLTRSNPSNPTEDRLASHKANVAAVRNAAMIDDLGAQIRALVSDFYAYDPIKECSLSAPDNRGDCAASSIKFTIYCCGTDLT